MKTKSIHSQLLSHFLLPAASAFVFLLFLSPHVCLAQWVARYNGPSSSWDIVKGIAIDGNGNVYVTGGSNGPGTQAERSDVATIRYDADGNPSNSWPDVGFGVGVRRYNAPSNKDDYGNAIAIDSSGHVYVAGYTTHNGSGQDFLILKYDSNGNLSETWPNLGSGAGVSRVGTGGNIPGA